MRLISSLSAMKDFSRQALAGGRGLGLVPTMGALHEGHASLVRRAKQETDCAVVSVFVNPTQFGPREDLSRYPANKDKDIELLDALSVDAVFAPAAAEMYPDGFETFVVPDEIAARLEGTARPGHFRGVATVVLKLFNIVRPNVACFGQKDFQQALVVRRLIEDLNLDVRLVVCPTVREADGLAMSSRNAYLGIEDRQAACVLYRSLKKAQELVCGGEDRASRILKEMQNVLATERRAQLEYAVIAEPARLEPVGRATTGCVALVAARVGTARLIDNVVLGPASASGEDLLQLALGARPIIDSRPRVPGTESERVRGNRALP